MNEGQGVGWARYAHSKVTKNGTWRSEQSKTELRGSNPQQPRQIVGDSVTDGACEGLREQRSIACDSRGLAFGEKEKPQSKRSKGGHPAHLQSGQLFCCGRGRQITLRD